MRFEQEILQQKFENLPFDLQEALTSVDYAEKLQKIGQDHRLLLDQLDKLFEETAFAMLGLSNPADFSKHIEHELHIDSRLAQAVARDVNEEIFAPIRTSLMDILEKEPKPHTEPDIPPVVRVSPLRITTPVTTPKPPVSAPTPQVTPARTIQFTGRQPIELKIDTKSFNTSPTKAPIDLSNIGESKEDLLAAIENLPKAEIPNTFRASAPSISTPIPRPAPQTLTDLKTKTEGENAAFGSHLSFPKPPPATVQNQNPRPIDKLSQAVKTATVETTISAPTKLPPPSDTSKKADPYRETF